MSYTDIPPYDLDKLRQAARLRLIEDGTEPTDLRVYYLIARLRAEEIRAATRDRHLDESPPVLVAGGMIEEPSHE